ncbi:MAG: sulfatase [Armatimonadota bacterium]
MSEKLNFIVILCDTFRWDFLSSNGSTEVQTPYLDRLAAESVVFDNAYACSFPTLPCRAELFTGKFIFPYLTWGPLPEGETTLAQRMGALGYHTALICDTLPLQHLEYGYDRGFQSRIRLRGQWYDKWADASIPVSLPAPAEKLDQHDRVRQYLRNVAGFQREDDYFAPQVMQTAGDWLERFAHRGPFFLWIDCFDPHEPWDPPAEYLDPRDATGDKIIYPILGRADRYSAAELASLRRLYAGEVRMVDRWIGKLVDEIDRLGLRENTVLVFLADHGIFLGEHNLLGKASKRRQDVDGWPPYHEVGHVPFMVRLPGNAPRHVNGFVHPGDLMPTLLELGGGTIPPEVDASSLLPLMRGEKEHLRDIAITAWSYRGWRRYHPSCIRDHEWSMIWWRSGVPPRLHHLPSDPGEVNDVFPEHREVGRRLHAQYVDELKRLSCPPKAYWSRRFFLTGSPNGRK